MIADWNDYHELNDLTDTAKNRLVSGQGPSGTHYTLIHILKSKHGLMVMSREEAIAQAQRLLDEFIKTRVKK